MRCEDVAMTDQLTPMEAIMWRVGQDATLRMTIGALVLLDRPPKFEALSERLAFAMDNAPRLRRRPDELAPARSRPEWIDDDDPSPDLHLRSLSVAAPGSMRQVLDFVGLLEAVPFDPARSPWDVTLVEGLEHGRAALYLRAHHALTDGVGAIRLLGLLLDEPQWPRRAPRSTAAEQPVVAAPPAESGQRGRLTITIDFPAAMRRVMQSVSVAREVDPVDSAVRGVQRALDVANSVSRQLLVTGGPLSSRPASRSLLSRFEVISVDGALGASIALGGSRNDLLIAAAAAGLGRYHEELGHPTDELRLATPTGFHRDHEAGGNWFAPARLAVPTSVGRPGPQFGVVVERLAQARSEPALQLASTLAAGLGRLPTRVLVPALNAQADSVDFAATALPGLRGVRHICGSRIEATYPLGPRLGCPLNLTAFGNGARLDVGIAIDPGTLTEPDHLVECLTEAFNGYVATAVRVRKDASTAPPAEGTQSRRRSSARSE
jgi:diacylglycerol O-acyltransferase / wax synthase